MNICPLRDAPVACSPRPEALPIHHRHLDTEPPGRRPRRVVAGVGVPDDADTGVVEEDASEPRGAVLGAVGEDLGAGVDGAADADAAPVVDGHPARAAGGGEHRVQDGPVGYGVRAVLHGFCLAVGGCDAAGVEVVAAYDDRGAYRAVGDELVEAEAGAGAFAPAGSTGG